MMKSYNKRFIQLKDILFLILYGCLSLAIFLPYLFSSNVVSQNQNSYVLIQNSFGKSQFYSIYVSLTILLEYIFTLFIIAPLSIILLINYIQLNRRKLTIASILFSSNILKEKTKRELTKVVLVESILFVLSRLAYASFRIFKLLNKYQFDSDEYYNFIILILFIFVEMNTYFILCLHFFISFIISKTFRSSFIRIFCFKK